MVYPFLNTAFNGPVFLWAIATKNINVLSFIVEFSEKNKLLEYETHKEYINQQLPLLRNK